MYVMYIAFLKDTFFWLFALPAGRLQSFRLAHASYLYIRDSIGAERRSRQPSYPCLCLPAPFSTSFPCPSQPSLPASTSPSCA